ncbi:MAG TPA: hypothetical protein DCF91_10875 [Porphyromonadaceae bacterium]|nr:hypothetical protein [Porphyromonadaceae bacterium]
MKKLVMLLLAIVPFVGAIAQTQKIGYVKTGEIFNAMPELPGIEKQLNDLQETYQKELKNMQSEYDKKYSDFIAQGDSLTENIKMKRMQELQDLEQRMQNVYQVAQQDNMKKQQELLAPVQQKIADAIKAVGTENGFAYLLENNPQIVLFVGTGAVDATPQVKAKLGLK